MNPMMQALEQSRSSNPAPTGGQTPGIPDNQSQPGNPGQDMAKYWSMMQDMSAKLDKLIEAISGQHTGKATGSEDVESKDGNYDKGAY